MRDETTVRPARRHRHLAEAFFLEIYIADGQDFIDEENLRLEVSSESEG